MTQLMKKCFTIFLSNMDKFTQSELWEIVTTKRVEVLLTWVSTIRKMLRMPELTVTIKAFYRTQLELLQRRILET